MYPLRVSLRLNQEPIERAVTAALESISRDHLDGRDLILDRDTRGRAGAPGIEESIFGKIGLCSAFVADVSLVAATESGKLVPNPNVMMELGYAAAVLGWDRIVMVMNVERGGPERLPFNLKGRRVETYSLHPDATGETRQAQEQTLGVQMETALRAILVTAGGGGSVPHSPASWWGRWASAEDGVGESAQLRVREVSDTGFFFQLGVVSGTHTGDISGTAHFISPRVAVARLRDTDDADVCELEFRRDRDATGLTITEVSSCHGFRGMGARFDCSLKRIREPLLDGGYLDVLDMARLYGVMGQFLWEMNSCLQLTGPRECCTDVEVSVTEGIMRGAANGMTAVVVRGSSGELWAAYTHGDEVRYFTTEPEHRASLPESIERWRAGFAELPVSYCPAPNVIERFWE